MTPDERREAVARILADDPCATQRQIASMLGVAQRTVGRDIAVMGLGSPRDSVTHGAAQQVSPQVNSADSQAIVAALNAELAAAAKDAGHELVWSAAEADVISMIASEVDRRVELSAAYAACDSIATRLKIATELRLTEQAIARLYRQVSTEVPAPMSVTSLKAQAAANSRWTRERMKQQDAGHAT